MPYCAHAVRRKVRYAPHADLAERCAAIRRNAAAPQTAASAAVPAVPVRRSWQFAAPVGHLLVTPRRHVGRLELLTKEEHIELMQTLSRIVPIMEASPGK